MPYFFAAGTADGPPPGTAFPIPRPPSQCMNVLSYGVPATAARAAMDRRRTEYHPAATLDEKVNRLAKQ